MNRMTDEVLKATIEKLVKDKLPVSITELGRLMGYSKISGDLSKRIKTMLPGLEELLKGNKVLREMEDRKTKTTQADKPAKKPQVKKSEGKKDKTSANGVPLAYRHGSNYQRIFEILYRHRDKGISRVELVKNIVKQGRQERLAKFDMAVVISPSQTGESHKSAKRACEKYYVERENDFLKLHMR